MLFTIILVHQHSHTDHDVTAVAVGNRCCKRHWTPGADCSKKMVFLDSLAAHDMSKAQAYLRWHSTC